MTTFLGGKREGVNMLRIILLRSAVRLEAKGLRPSRRLGSMTAKAKKELGLPRGTSREAVLAALDQAVEAQREVTKIGVDIIP